MKSNSARKKLQKISLPFEIGSGRKKLFGAKRMTMNFAYDQELQQIVGKVSFGVLSQGPPGHAHGGLLTFVLDEAMGALGWQLGYPVVAQRLNIEFKNMAPINHTLTVSARATRITKTKIEVAASLVDGKRPICRGTGRFHVLNPNQIKMLKMKL